jgi:hypothetical protein
MKEQLMSSPTDQTTGLIDIEAPPAPPLPPWQTMLVTASLIAVFAVVLFALWRRRHSPRGIARRRLAQLHTQHAGGRINGRDAAYELAALMRLGLGARQLRADAPPPAPADLSPRWVQLVNRLDDARYAAPSPTGPAIENLLAECAFWLGRTP